MISLFKSLEKYLVPIFLFLLPTQLAYHFWPAWAFIFGIRVDILAPAIYLADVLVILLFLIKIIKDSEFFKPLKKYKTALSLVLVFAIINSVFSTSVAVSVYKWLKVAEFAFLAFYFAKQKVIDLATIVMTLFYSSILFSVIGIIQFIKGGTIGGLLYYLGERSFTSQTPGIALVTLSGALYMRAYSTFSHPNSLAGFLGGVSLLVLLSGKLKKSLINIVGMLVILICFILTFSISAYLGIFVSFAFYLFSKNKKIFKWVISAFLFLCILGSLLLPIFSSGILSTFPDVSQNIAQRLDLSYIAGKEIGKSPLFGQGLGTFIVSIPTFKGIFSYSWLLQPVHNIYLLVFAETGMVGLLAFCFLIYKMLTSLLNKKSMYILLPIIFILFTGLFDHYSLSLQQNLLLVSLLIGLSIKIGTWRMN